MDRNKVVLASPRGFCAGVVRAIDIVNLALEVYGQPIYVRREIVHNKFVVNELRRKGIIFVNELDEVPIEGRVIFSAHGVAPEISAAAITRSLKVIDATCPLVTKVHREAIQYASMGYTIILIGHSDHDEVIGTLGEVPGSIMVLDPDDKIKGLEVPDPKKVVYLTQTTLSLNDTRAIVDQAPPARLPLIRISRLRRYMLCDAEPPERGAGSCPKSGVDPRSGFGKQLQFPSFGGSGPGCRNAGIFDRRHRKHQAFLVWTVCRESVSRPEHPHRRSW